MQSIPAHPRRATWLALLLCTVAGSAEAAGTTCSWRTSTAEEQRRDAASFEGLEQGIVERLTDVQSVVVVQQGRTAWQYYRDGDPAALRDPQSVAKTALATLVGSALRQGHIASLDTPVLELMPQWRSINADPRTQAVTVQHLLAMTAGFEVNDPDGTAPPLTVAKAWARPLRSAPGEAFAYDNSIGSLLIALLEKVSAQPLAAYAQQQLVQPLGMNAPSFRGGLQLRSLDMARLGQLFLQDGAWNGQALLPPGFAALSTRAHSAGGPPGRLPYGLSWWTVSDKTFFASGYGGQFIWLHPPLGAVVVVTSSVSPGSEQRGQALQLIRGKLFQALQKSWRAGCGE